MSLIYIKAYSGQFRQSGQSLVNSILTLGHNTIPFEELETLPLLDSGEDNIITITSNDTDDYSDTTPDMVRAEVEDLELEKAPSAAATSTPTTLTTAWENTRLATLQRELQHQHLSLIVPGVIEQVVHMTSWEDLGQKQVPGVIYVLHVFNDKMVLAGKREFPLEAWESFKRAEEGEYQG